LAARQADLRLALLADDLFREMSLRGILNLCSNSPSLTFGLNRVLGVRSAAPRSMFQKTLALIDDLRRQSVPTAAEETVGKVKMTGRGVFG